MGQQSIHTSSFQDFPPFGSDGASFDGGKGMGAGFGGLVDLRVTPLISFQLRAGYSTMPVELRDTAFDSYVAVNDRPFEVYSVHTLRPSLGALLGGPVMLVSIPPVPDLRIGVGVEGGVLIGKSFEYQETLREDAVAAGIRFSNGGTSRNVYPAGTAISNPASFFAAATFSGTYHIPIGEQLSVDPEASFALGLVSPVQDVEWNVNSIRLGLSIQYLLSGARR
jgi:hypothetical protein